MLYPWVRTSPGGGQWQPTPVFLPGESHGQRSLVGYSPWGCQKSDMTEQVTHTLLWVVPLGPWGHLLPTNSHRCSAQQTVGLGAGADVAADVEGRVTPVREMEGPAASPVQHGKCASLPRHVSWGWGHAPDPPSMGCLSRPNQGGWQRSHSGPWRGPTKHQKLGG